MSLLTPYLPGPWQIFPAMRMDDAIEIRDSDGRRVCIVRGSYPMGAKTDNANADLIISVHDLLAALEELSEWYTKATGLPAVNARAAIAKARGGVK